MTTEKPAAAKGHVSKREHEEALVQVRKARDILAELRRGYDEYYESGNVSRLLNVEAKVRDLYPRIAHV